MYIFLFISTGLIYRYLFSNTDILTICINFNLVIFLLYAYDKFAAIKNMQRIPEIQLHLCSLFLSTPGAFLGQRIFNHKLKKSSFMIKYWFITILQLIIGLVIYLNIPIIVETIK